MDNGGASTPQRLLVAAAQKIAPALVRGILDGQLRKTLGFGKGRQMYDGVVVHQRSGYNAVADDADICAETDSQVVVVFACDHVLDKGSCVGFYEFVRPLPRRRVSTA